MVGPSGLLEEDKYQSSILGDQSPCGSFYGDQPHSGYIYNNLTIEDEEAEYSHRGDSSEDTEEEEDDSYPTFSGHPTQGDRSVMGSRPGAGPKRAAPPTTAPRENIIDAIEDDKHHKAAKAVFHAFMGPPKKEDPTHIRL